MSVLALDDNPAILTGMMRVIGHLDLILMFPRWRFFSSPENPTNYLDDLESSNKSDGSKGYVGARTGSRVRTAVGTYGSGDYINQF